MKILIVAFLALVVAGPVSAQVTPFPEGFRVQRIESNGVRIYTRVGGKGPAVLLLHGYGESGDMWAPVAKVLARDHTVVVPDLRGMGMTSRPEAGYEKKNQAQDMAGVLDALKIQRADLVTHDIGNMVGYALAAQFPERVTRFVIMDAPLPGIGPWDEIVRSHALWHFSFGGPDAERLVAGRERIYLDRFWNEFSADPRRFSEASREHYASLYAQPGAMHAGFAQFAAFDQDAIDNKAFVARGKLAMPVLAVGGEKSFGPTMAAVMRFAASDVHEKVIPDAGHWLMEEQPDATTAAIVEFLEAMPAAEKNSLQPRRLTPEEIANLEQGGAGAGTSGLDGIRSTVLAGDPAVAGIYTLRLQVPPHQQIQAHWHRDARTAVVVSGHWRIGYGEALDAARLKTLSPGSFYTEPAGAGHFAETEDEPVVVYITGYGPTDTNYLR